MTLTTARVRRTTLTAVDRLRRSGRPVNRTTLAAEMGVSGPCAAHRLAVLASIGSIRVDPLPRRVSPSQAELGARIEAAHQARAMS